MEYYSFFPRKSSRLFLILIFVLSVLLMAVSATHKHYNSYACYGLIGEGHPFDFLCDYSDGAILLLGPAPESTGKIDWFDPPYLSAQGFIMDLLFYCVIVLMIWFVATYSIYQFRRRMGNRG